MASPVDENPYSTPDCGDPGRPTRPGQVAWIAGGVLVGAGLAMAAHIRLRGLTANGLSYWLLGGGVAGGVLGRMFAQMRMAAYAFRLTAARRSELKDELDERRRHARAMRTPPTEQ